MQTGEEIRRNIQSSIYFINTFFHLYVVWQPNCRVIHLVYCVGGHTALHREKKKAPAEEISKISSASPRRYQKPRIPSGTAAVLLFSLKLEFVLILYFSKIPIPTLYS